MEKYKLAKLNDCHGDLSQQWYVYYSFIHPETKLFVRFRKSISNKLLTKVSRYTSASDIIKKINRWLKQGGSPFDGDNSNIPLERALEDYIKSIEHKVRSRTLHSYRCYVTKLQKFLKEQNLTDLRVSAFSEDLANSYMDWIKNTCGLSNRTFNNYKESTSTIFKHFIHLNYTETNPLLKIKHLQEEEASITCLTPEELRKMKQTLPEENYPLYAIACMIFYAFIRPQEIVRLRVENIDLKHQQIRMPGSTTKNKRTQVVVIPDPLLEVLVKLRNLNAPGNHFIFSSKLLSGTFQIAPTRIAEIWRRWANKQEIYKQIYHLKHTGVGMAIESGINARDLQLQLRHASLDETQKYLEKFKNIASDRLKSSFPRF